MTREKAIKQIETAFDVWEDKYAIGDDWNEQHEARDMAIQALKQTRWIPVSERLPNPQKDADKDFSDWVQVTIDIGRNDVNNLYVCEAYYCFSENKWYTKRFVIGVVTAWMPQPEPYVPDINVGKMAESEVKG